MKRALIEKIQSGMTAAARGPPGDAGSLGLGLRLRWRGLRDSREMSGRAVVRACVCTQMSGHRVSEPLSPARPGACEEAAREAPPPATGV